MTKHFEVGMIIESPTRQYARIISFKRGLYGLSGWMSRGNAEKATVAAHSMNVYGLTLGGFKVVSGAGNVAPTKPAKAAKKAAPKKAPAKAKVKAKAKTAKRKR